eukprot:15440673-Alexandrium_andersonii.AAC.1
MWMLFSADVWLQNPGLSKEENFLNSLDHLRAELFVWYSSPEGRGATRLQGLTQKMVGTAADPRLNTKAMETYGLACFCCFASRSILGDLAPKDASSLRQASC